MPAEKSTRKQKYIFLAKGQQIKLYSGNPLLRKKKKQRYNFHYQRKS